MSGDFLDVYRLAIETMVRQFQNHIEQKYENIKNLQDYYQLLVQNDPLVREFRNALRSNHLLPNDAINLNIYKFERFWIKSTNQMFMAI